MPLMPFLGKAWLCIEIEEKNLFIWQIHRNSKCPEKMQFPIPAQAGWDAQALADLINEPIPRGKVLILLNSTQIVLRLTEDMDINYVFPIGEGFREDDYVFSHSLVGGMCLMAAIPNAIYKCLNDFCQIKKLRGMHLLDTIEHRLACYFGEMQKEPTWLLIHQESSVRLIVLNYGFPRALYLLSNDANFRVMELERILQCQLPEDFPIHAMIFPNDLEWLCDFIEKKGIAKLEMPDIRTTLLHDWVKRL